jgi:hypothetical protein
VYINLHTHNYQLRVPKDNLQEKIFENYTSAAPSFPGQPDGSSLPLNFALGCEKKKKRKKKENYTSDNI